MSIIIGGDIVPTASNMELFEQGNVEKLTDEGLRALLSSADYRIFNMEEPLTDHPDPIPKCGPNMRASAGAVRGLKGLSADFVTLANNHILDHGEQGLLSTVETLEKAGIAWAGVGRTAEAAAKPHIFTVSGRRVGVYCCAEQEFSIVAEGRAGANPFDALESPDHVAALKAQCDFVIVLYHGGKEYYRYPSPGLQKVCRKLIRKGADLVVCQHSHCIGCEEDYAGGKILYGQGNFLFDGCDEECWQTSLLIRIDDDFRVEYIPLEKQKNAVALAAENRDRILRDFRDRSAQIREPGFVQENYQKFADSLYGSYMMALQGKRYRSAAFRALNKLSGHRLLPWLLRRNYGEKNLCSIQNNIRCEAHREVFLAGLNSHRS